MATPHPRIQVTVDAELAEALRRIDPHPRSHSRLVRDLALRGAAQIEDERAAQQAACELLLAVADGDERYDLGTVAALAEARGDRLP